MLRSASLAAGSGRPQPAYVAWSETAPLNRPTDYALKGGHQQLLITKNYLSGRNPFILKKASESADWDNVTNSCGRHSLPYYNADNPALTYSDHRRSRIAGVYSGI